MEVKKNTLEMNIMYCGDANIAAGLSLSVLSLIRYNPQKLNVYVLTMSLETEQKKYEPVPANMIAALEKKMREVNPESRITVIDVTELFRKELPESNLRTRFTPYCMLRLFADRLPEIPDRILYLDTDVLCRGSLVDFYNQNLENQEYAGVLDFYGSWFFYRKFPRRDYCNSGVLLLNMKEIRRTGLFTACRKMIRERKMFFPDQSAINRLTRSRRLADRKYNEQRKLREDTVLQHFSTSLHLFPVFHTLTVKPWQMEKMHKKLHLYEYDDLYKEYLCMKNKGEDPSGREGEVIPVFFSADDNYAPYLAETLASLMDNADPAYEYKLIVLCDDLSDDNKTRVKKLEKPGFDIQFVSMKERLLPMTEKLTNRLRCDYFTMTIYFRLFIPDMFPQYQKGLYLDCDIAVCGDISRLYHQDLEGKPVGACIDLSIQNAPPLIEYIEKAVGVDHRKYVNSGVLLMDLDQLRKMEFSKNFLNLLNTWHFDSIAPDQDYINAMLQGNIHFLDNSWNLFPEAGKPEEKNPNLIHYNLFSKPWCYDGLPYESYFWKYARQTDYYEEIQNSLHSYSDEKKAQDAENMKQMAARGLEIAEKGVRFSDVLGKSRNKITA